MEEVIKRSQNKELLVRKRIALFLEKILRFLGYDFRHDIYKGITYFEIAAETEFEEKIKNLYDGFIYLLHNNKNPLTIERLEKFFYLIYSEKFDGDVLIRLTSTYFYMKDIPLLEKVIEYHVYVYNQLVFLSEEDRTIISLMFINYILTSYNIPCIHFLMSDLEKYIKYRNEYFNGKPEGLFTLIYEVLKKSKFQDKTFYKELTQIDNNLIFNKLNEDKEMLLSEYFVENIYIYGSFSKQTNRLDSDIDLLITFSPSLLPSEKKELMNTLKDYYFKVLNRYIDIHEINKHLKDVEIKEFRKIKKIF